MNSKGAALLSDEMQADWNCWHVCGVEPAGRLTTGDGTPPPVTDVAVDSGTSDADVPGAGAEACPVVDVTLKPSEPPGKPAIVSFTTWLLHGCCMNQCNNDSIISMYCSP